MLYQIELTGNILQSIDVPTGINPKSVTGVACENGHVWTMDRNNAVVHKYDGTSGELLQTFPFPSEFQGSVPRGIAYLPDRGTFMVGATYGQNHSRVYELTTTDFTFTGNTFDFDMEFDPSNNFFNSSLRGIAYNPLTGNYWLGDVLTDIIYEVLPFSGQINGLLVTNTNDAGFGSLRQAINNANSDGQPSLIEFYPTLLGQTIYPQIQLPSLVEDGTTINGDINADGLPDIEISRGSPDIVNGILIESANNTLRGLLINNFNGPGGPGYSGIRLTGSNAHHNTIVSCYIGTDITKSENRSNRSGILLRNGAHDNIIGGLAPGQGNVIYYNTWGVNIGDNGTIGNTITRNSIAGNGITGIILSSGGNNQIASPMITEFSGSALTGTTYPFSTVEVFTDAFNQGEEYLGTTFSEMSGNFSFSGVFPENRIYNVTVTDPSGNTSAFSSFLRQKEINANHWRVQLLNNGTFAQDFLVGVGGNGAGGEYPKGLGTYIIYSGGHYLGTLKNGTPSVSHIEYTNSDYLPGRIINENPAPLDQLSPEYPLRSKNRVYVIDSTRSGSDWDNWPEEDGAPVDANGDPLLISPQDSWTVFNDMYVPVHSGGGDPVLGMEVQRSTYSYTLNGAADAFIVKWRIINKSTNNYPESYFGIWFDPDLVDYANDLMGTDTTLNMAYFYNSNNNDEPRAFGACLLKGPIADGQVRELAATYGFGVGGDPVDDNQRYNIMRGLDRWGNPKPFGPFDFTGDPLTNLGNLDWNPGDKRLIISSGPFTLYAGNIQEVVLACIGATGGDRLEALANLRETTRLVQEFYNRPTVSISMTKGVRNFKTPVRIEVNNPKSLLGGDFKILYDRNILTLAEADIKLTPLTSDFVRSVRVTQTQGIVSVALSRAIPIASEQKGVLIKLPFRVNNTAPLGSTTQLIFSEANLSYQYSLPNLVNPIMVKGSLKVMDNPLFGDLNQNGSYDLPDAVLILKAVIEMFNDVDPYQELLADANRNNVLAINDAMVVLNQLVLTKTNAAGKDSDIPADTTININLKISSIQGSPGETVIIPLQSDSLKLFGFDCALRYDARALKLKAVVPVSSSDLFINNVADQGQFHFALLNREGLGNENGELINLEFEILSGGEHFLTIDKAQGIPSQTDIAGSEIPGDFALYQNYPNPFNPGTTIRYDLPQDSRVHLVIFNTLGQKIVTLVNEDQKAGKHQFDWYPQQLSSGIYIISINAGDFVENRKAIFMK